jgi:hypothetical protein
MNKNEKNEKLSEISPRMALPCMAEDNSNSRLRGRSTPTVPDAAAAEAETTAAEVLTADGMFASSNNGMITAVVATGSANEMREDCAGLYS